ncbi:uncharacterized protein LOC122613454 [Drosophila teissieri]|uniref:uncharacterized protein LOC122613454 n=1 Tax=Drosophila teissieri TaxID=7243 RepID=UPI001CBA1A26|nr:uncharacterized protein LOC122613454 [Drosophila teissieri]
MANEPGKPTLRSRFCTVLDHEVLDPNEYMVHFAKRRKDELIIESQMCGWCYKLDFENLETPKLSGKQSPKLSDARISQRSTSPPGAGGGTGGAAAGAGAEIPGPSTSSDALVRGIQPWLGKSIASLEFSVEDP